MKYPFATLCLLVLAIAAPAHGQDLEAQLKVCATCHGAGGISSDPLAPSLAGQKEGYLRAQLQDFRDGARQDPQMSPQAHPLDDAQIDALSAYYSGLPLPPQKAGGPQLDPTQRPLVYCVRCHGSDGVSPNDIWPNLAGLSVPYMEKQVQAFYSGERKDDMMAMWAEMVKPEQLQEILRYFNHQGSEPAR